MRATDNSVKFGRPYYERVISENGYDPGLFEGFAEDMPQVPREDLERIFLCHSGLYEFRDSPQAKGVLTGFGLSGVPHLGTLSQINRIGLLNRSGYHAEVILGDLDAYNGKLTPIAETHELASTYANFIQSTELLDPENSTVRNQFDNPAVLRTAYLIGRFLTDGMFVNAEEDLHDLYVSQGKVDSDMTYRRKLSLNLMLADFFHLGQTHPEVLVMLGLDEHQYVQTGQAVAEKIDEQSSGLKPVRISSLYTPLIRGFNGFPKMSKSFPGSGITLDMPTSAVEKLIMDERDDHETPEDSVVYQVACGIGLGAETTLGEAYQAAQEKRGEWYDIKKLVVARIASFGRLWQEAVQQ